MRAFTSPKSPMTVAIALVMVSTLIGCPKKEDPPVDKGKGPVPEVRDPRQKDKGSDKGGLPANAPVLKVTAEKFREEYQKDAKATEDKYRGSIVEISGVIHSITPRLLGEDNSDELDRKQAMIRLHTGKVTNQVYCILDDPEPWKKVSAGQTVKIKGVFPEATTSPVLINCTLAEFTPTPTPTLSAEQLAAEFATDKNAALKKYEDKLLIVTGEVAEKQTTETGIVYVFFKGKDKVRVRFGFSASAFDADKAIAFRIQVGQKHTILGTLTGFNSDEGSIAFYPAELIKKP